MIALSSGMAFHQSDFIAYRRRLPASGKKPMVAAFAVAHRAHRLAFGMMRSGHPFDEHRWSTGVAKGRPAPVTSEVTATT